MENLEEKSKNHNEIENYGEDGDKRREIIDKFIESFKDKEKNGVYEAKVNGSFSKGEEDEYSDVDLSIVTEEGKTKETIENFENFLSQFGEIDKKLLVERENGPIQLIYHLRGMSKYHTVDFIIKFKETEPEKKEESISEIKKDIDEKENKKGIFEHCLMLVEKEIKREELIRAGRLYVEYIFDSIVKLVRSKYTPDEVDKGTKDLEKHLDKIGRKDLREKIEKLGLSQEEIERKMDEAKSLYEMILKEN